MSFSPHLENSAQKSFAVLRMIRRTFSRITRMDFQLLCGAYVRPLLEYANPIVYSGRTKDVTLIELVQRAATKLVAGLESVDHETRLAVLDHLPLEYLRLRGDLILIYTLFEQALAKRFSPLTQQTHVGDMVDLTSCSGLLGEWILLQTPIPSATILHRGNICKEVADEYGDSMAWKFSTEVLLGPRNGSGNTGSYGAVLEVAFLSVKKESTATCTASFCNIYDVVLHRPTITRVMPWMSDVSPTAVLILLVPRFGICLKAIREVRIEFYAAEAAEMVAARLLRILAHLWVCELFAGWQ
ncbi:hypothetical protein CLF_108905 [Clonorchis sinensis]|uniref:Uncharacterized protein n=1 Tax=Clonorchis sinensis TaxID=79923 RepID=H2KUF7_CLOSI|nr:hypothetical protein CLF_108905 [Clonorchis sinensis]